MAKYTVHPVVAYARAILDNLPGKTGKSLEEWVALVKAQGPEGPRERKAWLKEVHDLGGTTVNLIVGRASGESLAESEPEAYLAAAARYVEEMYGGQKAALRPLHDTLIDLALKLGQDVKISPSKTIVPLYRHHVFAQIKPSTRTRLDLGLALKGFSGELTPRLVDTGGLAKGDRITHRIPLSRPEEIDAEVEHWLAAAYESDS